MCMCENGGALTEPRLCFILGEETHARSDSGSLQINAKSANPGPGRVQPCAPRFPGLLPGLVRAPRALLVVDRGFALVVVAEVWAAAAAAASVARFCSCKAFMPVRARESALATGLLARVPARRGAALLAPLGAGGCP